MLFVLGYIWLFLFMVIHHIVIQVGIYLQYYYKVVIYG